MITNKEFMGLKWVSESYTATINTGTEATITITPPPGQIYKLNSFRFYVGAPPGAASGTHSVQFYAQGYSGYYLEQIKLSSVFGSPIALTNSEIVGDNNKAPTDDTDILRNLVSGFIFSNSHYMTITYKNSTDVNNTNDVSVQAIFEVFKGEEL